MEKYKKIKDGNDSDDDSNFIEKKFRTLKNELDKMVKNNKKRSLSRESDDDRQEKESKRPVDRKRRDSPNRRRRVSPESSRRGMQGRNDGWRRREMPDRRYDSRATEYKKKSRTPDKKRLRTPEKRKDRSRSREKNRRESPKRKKSRSPRQESPKRDRRASPQQNSHKKNQQDIPIDHKNDAKYRNPSPPKQRQMFPKRKSSSGSRSPSPPKRPMQFDDSDDERRARKPKSFGLVTASGEKIALERKQEVRRYTKEELKVSRDAPKKHENKRKKPLTEEEMEAMRTEMMKNADWREKDREKTVKKHRALEEEEKSKHQKDFDKDFLNKHMKKAQDQLDSVATRIKSNLNNIQRTSRTMDSNFVRR